MLNDENLKKIKSALEIAERKNRTLGIYLNWFKGAVDVFLKDFQEGWRDDDLKKTLIDTDEKTFSDFFVKKVAGDITKKNQEEREDFYQFLYFSIITFLCSNLEDFLDELCYQINNSWYSYRKAEKGKKNNSDIGIALNFLQKYGINVKNVIFDIKLKKLISIRNYFIHRFTSGIAERQISGNIPIEQDMKNEKYIYEYCEESLDLIVNIISQIKNQFKTFYLRA